MTGTDTGSSAGGVKAYDNSILQDIDAELSSLRTDAPLDETSSTIDKCISLAAKLPSHLHAMVVKRLSDTGLVYAKSAKARLAICNGNGHRIDRSKDVLSEDPARDHDAPPLARAPNPPSPFRILGHDRGIYYYLSKEGGQVVELSADRHNEKTLRRLAPDQYWERVYPGNQGANYSAAINALIADSHRMGIYSTDRVRGRGAWWDHGGVVIHLGDQLVVDGVSIPLTEVTGRYLYEFESPLVVPLDDPMGIDESRRFLALVDRLRWERPISGRLLSGWIAVAPICGALSWRPHIWITGPSGSGKTWVMDNLITPVLGAMCLHCQSNTTEAGLRQILGMDALPVVFDEAESDDQRGQARLANVLELVRQASSESGAPIIKGTVGGSAKIFRIRSCFAFSSVAGGPQLKADTSRVSILAIRSDIRGDAKERFLSLERDRTALLTPDYINRIRARTIRMIPTIRESARVFAEVGSESSIFGSRRMGDQIGALLAGAWALWSDNVITPDEARDKLSSLAGDMRPPIESGDEYVCLQHIHSYVLKVNHDGIQERSIAEMLTIAMGRKADNVTKEEAENALQRMGVRTIEGTTEYIISSSAPAMSKILDNTPWRNGWGRILRRIPGAKATPNSVRFAGVLQRGVILDLYMDSPGEDISDPGTAIDPPDPVSGTERSEEKVDAE